MRSSKKLIAWIAGIVVFFVLLWLLDTALYPCTYLRNDIHTVSVKQADVLIMGTSNGKMGIDPDILLKGTDLSGHNLAAGSEYPVDSYYMMKLAIEKQKPSKLIYELDPAYFTTEKEKGNNYLLFYHEFPVCLTKIEYAASILHDADIRALLFPFYEYPLSTTVPRIGKTFGKKISGDYSAADLKNSIQEYHENGFIEKFPVSEDKFPSYSPDPFKRDEVREDNTGWVDKLIRLCADNGVEFIAVTMPLPDKTIEMNNESLTESWAYFEDFFAERNIKYYNFNTQYYKSFSHIEEQYVDYDGHLNGDSAREFSEIFGQILKRK